MKNRLKFITFILIIFTGSTQSCEICLAKEFSFVTGNLIKEWLDYENCILFDNKITKLEKAKNKFLKNNIIGSKIRQAKKHLCYSII